MEKHRDREMKDSCLLGIIQSSQGEVMADQSCSQRGCVTDIASGRVKVKEREIQNDEEGVGVCVQGRKSERESEGGKGDGDREEKSQRGSVWKICSR